MLADGASDANSDEEQRAMRLLLPLGDSDDCSTGDSADESVDHPHTSSEAQDACVEVAVRPGVTVRVTTRAAKGIGFQLWPAAHVAAHYAQTHPHLWRGARVCELGAGCGLTGLQVACQGAHVTVTDLPDVVDGLLAANVAANAQSVAACGGSVRAAPLAWGDPGHAAELGSEWDVLLCCDVVYRRHLFSPLVTTLRAMAAPQKTMVVIAHLKRWKFESDFFKELSRHFTPREEVHVQAVAGQRRPVRVFTCRLK